MAAKQANSPETNLTFRARHRFARMSPYKVRLDMDQVRGQRIEKALEILEFSRRRGAKLIYKVLRSAVANAEHKIDEHGIDVDITSLVVTDARVDEGPKFRRWRPRARGAAFQIIKRSCHISIGLTPIAEDADSKTDGKRSGRTRGTKR